jgi:hypothetical protein
LNTTNNDVISSSEFIKNTAKLLGENGCGLWWQKDVDYFLDDDVSLFIKKWIFINL